jgi:hypothetical protein
LVYRNEGGDEPPRVGRIETSEAPGCGFRGSARRTLASFAFARRYSPERGAESDQFGRGS